MIEEKLDRIIELLEAQANGTATAPAPEKPKKPVKQPEPSTTEPEEEEDDLAGDEDETEETPKKIVLADVQDAVRRAAGVDKAKTKKVLEKFGAQRATDVKEANYGKVINELAKIK